VIDSGILSTLSEIKFNELTTALKNRRYKTVQKWTASNLDNEPSHIFRSIYDNLYEFFEESDESIPRAVLILGKYQDMAPHVADQEINLMSAFTEIMYECKFK